MSNPQTFRPFLAVIALIAVCASLIAVARALAQHDVISTVDLATGNCDQPCWHGFRPGEALVTDIRDHGAYAAEVDVAVRDTSDNIARRFTLTRNDPPFIMLADVIRELGPPERVSCLQPNRIETPHGGAWSGSLWLYWAGGLVAAQALNMHGGMVVAPDMRVWAISYYEPGEPTYAIGTGLEWAGFGSWRRYPVCFPLE